MMDVFWMVAEPWDSVAGAARTVRATNCDLTACVLLGGVEYLPILADGPTFSTSIFDGAAISSTPSTRGAINVLTGEGEADDWDKLGWSTRSIKLYFAEINPDAPDFPTALTPDMLIFDGQSESIKIDDGLIALSALKPSGRIARTLYGGTGWSDGNSEIKGTVKPWAAGSHRNRAPVLVDPAKLLFQVHGYGAIAQLTTIKERGVTLDQTRVSHSDEVSLMSATVPATEIHQCLATGTFRLGFQPIGQVTCDFEGAANGGYSALPGDLVHRLLGEAGWPDSRIHIDTLDDLNASLPFDAWSFDDQGADVLDKINELLNPIGAYWDIDADGKFYVGLFWPKTSEDVTIGAAQFLADYELSELTSVPTRAPFWRNRMGWGYNPAVFSETDLVSPTGGIIADSATPPYPAVDRQGWRDPATGKLYVYSIDAATAGGDPLTVGGTVLISSGWVEVRDNALPYLEESTTQAATDTAAALAQISDMLSDGVLTREEKPRFKADYAVILGEQAGIVAKATLYGITTEKTAYQNAISAVTTELAKLYTPVLWDSLDGDTTISGSPIRALMTTVYDTRRTLLNKIAELAQRALEGLNADGTVKDDKVTNPAVINNSITRPASIFGDLGGWRQTPSYGTWTDLGNGTTTVQVSLTTNATGDQRVKLTAVLLVKGDGSDKDNASFRIVRGSTPIGLEWTNIELFNAIRVPYTFVFWDDAPAAGTTYTYKLQWCPLSDGWSTFYNYSLDAVLTSK